MKSVPLSKHIKTAGLILLISYLVFTFLPDLTPAPEDLSPYVYLSASIWVLWVCVQLPKRQSHKWAYWLIWLLCTLALLDEAGYGVEVFGFEPWHIDRYNVDIHDLHNLIGLGFELLSAWLKSQRWNGALFLFFLAFDAALLVAGAVWLAVARRGLAKAAQPRWQARLLRVAAGGLALAGVVAAGVLLALPRDPNNEVFLGLSLVRLASLLLILVPSFAPAIAMWRAPKAIEKRVAQWMKKPGWLFISIELAVFAALAYQLYVTFLPHPDQIARVERLTPIVLWLLAYAVVLWLTAQLWRGELRQPLLPLWWQRLLAFLQREPAFFYTAIALVLIAIAQAIDKELIPLNSWIKTPDFHVQLWGLWTEEAFEMIGAYLFMAAAYYSPRKTKSK
jgi:hypothetical protein